MNSESYIRKLLQETQIEWKPLGDVADFFGGLTGKSKSDFENGNAKYISYKNIYRNIGVDFDDLETVKIRDGEEQNRVKYGDILVTGSSESSNDAGMTSVVTIEPKENVYLNSFSFGIRFNQNLRLIPEFSKHLFRSSFMRSEIAKTASGVTRFNISKSRLKKIEIPIPCPDDPKRSQAIQTEIAEILNSFTALTAELRDNLISELTTRKQQYQYYRDNLLSFDRHDVEWRPLGEIGEFIRGKRFTKADYVVDGIDAIHYGDIYTRYGVYTRHAHSQVRADLAESLRYAKHGDVIIAGVGETVEDVGKAVAWLGENDVAIHDDSYAFRHSLNPKFVSYLMQTANFIDNKARHVSRGKINRLLINGLEKVLIPVPYPNDVIKSLEEQNRVVAILDNLNTLTNSLIESLPREIELRRKQYEYYRDLLLTFPRTGTAEGL